MWWKVAVTTASGAACTYRGADPPRGGRKSVGAIGGGLDSGEKRGVITRVEGSRRRSPGTDRGAAWQGGCPARVGSDGKDCGGHYGPGMEGTDPSARILGAGWSAGHRRDILGGDWARWSRGSRESATPQRPKASAGSERGHRTTLRCRPSLPLSWINCQMDRSDPIAHIFRCDVARRLPGPSGKRW